MALKLDTVKKLRQEIRNNLDRYQPGSSGFEFDNDDGRLIGRKFHQNDIPDLAPPAQNYKPDINNCLNVYNFLTETAGLRRFELADPGLWVYLTHEMFFQYSSQRYQANTDTAKLENQIGRYFFMTERQHSNAICGLYLIIELTRAPWEQDPIYFSGVKDSIAKADPYFYSKIICAMPDYKMFFQHRMVRSIRVMIAFLEAYRSLEEEYEQTSPQKFGLPEKGLLGKYDINMFAKILSLSLPVRNFQDLDFSELVSELKTIILELNRRDYNNKSKGLSEKLSLLASSGARP